MPRSQEYNYESICTQRHKKESINIVHEEGVCQGGLVNSKRLQGKSGDGAMRRCDDEGIRVQVRKEQSPTRKNYHLKRARVKAMVDSQK